MYFEIKRHGIQPPTTCRFLLKTRIGQFYVRTNMDTIVKQIASIISEEIDSNYIEDLEYLRSYDEREDRHIFIAIKDGDSHEILNLSYTKYSLDSTVEVLGVLLCGSYTYKEYAEYMYEDIETLVSQTDSEFGEDVFPIYLLQCLAVKSSYQSQGIGTALVGSGTSSNVSHYPHFAGGWKREGEQRNINIMESYGTYVGSIEDYYPDTWDCSYCDGDCNCDSVFYMFNP